MQIDLQVIEEKLNLLLKDKDFRRLCKQICTRRDFDSTLKMCEKIAVLDIKGSVVEMGLIYLQPENHYTDEEFQNGIFEFFRTMDSLAPEGESLTKIIADNMEYIEVVVKQENYRSFCAADFTQKNRRISVNVEGRVNDVVSAIHEFTHSASGEFRKLAHKKDGRMGELLPVIADQLAPMILVKLFPRFKESFQEARLESQVLNVIKARKSVIEGMIIKMMVGEVSKEQLIEKYFDLFGKDMNMAARIYEEIINHKFDAMFEARYLLPQAAALEMAERFAENPQEVAKMFKSVLLQDDVITLEEALKLLNLPSEENLIDEYVQKFPARLDRFKSHKLEKTDAIQK